MIKIKKSSIHWIFYAIISLIILFPLLNNYYLTLDWISTPSISPSNAIFVSDGQSDSVIMVLLIEKILSYITPASLIQKLSIFLIFFLSGISMHNLVNTKSQIPKYFAGILYMINPYVYIRFMAGHWLILLAYAITPFVVKSIIKFFENRNIKQTIKTCLWISLIAAINTHTLFLVLILFTVFLAYNFFKTKDKNVIKSTLILGLFFLVLNSYWLIPLFTSESTKLDQITANDLSAFRTKKGELNQFVHTLMMYGFWRENAYALPINIIPAYIYYSIFIIILFLTIHGYLNCEEKYKLPILITGIIAQILAVGIGHPWFRDYFTFLFNHIFFMKGFREPQKFVALLIFTYAFLAAHGIDSILSQIKKNKLKIAVSIIILLIPIAYTPTMFNSFWNQIHTTDYPNDWYEMNAYLNNDSQDFNILFLPWHLYMDFKWIPNKDKRIANPAEQFFDKPIIQGDNVEVGNIYSSSSNPISDYIQARLRNITGEDLRILNVRYIILAKEVDFRNYLYLTGQQDLELVKETQTLLLFKNKHEVSKFYQTEDLNKPEISPLKYEKQSPIKYKLSVPDKKYIIFTDPYNQHWKLGSEQPSRIGAVNLYEYKGNDTLKYSRFNVYLISYIISKPN